MRISPLVIAATIGVLTASCGSTDGSKSRMKDVSWDADISHTGHTVSITYQIENTAARPLVVYNAGWVSDPKNPDPTQVEATKSDIQIVVHDDIVEFGLRIIHTCHGNPEGQLTRTDTGKRADCGRRATDESRVQATTLGLNESVSGKFSFDSDTLFADYPNDVADTRIDLTDKKIRFCIGVDRPARPRQDGLYAPASHETILCTKPVDADATS